MEALTHLASKQVAAVPALIMIGALASGFEPFTATSRLGPAVTDLEELRQHQQPAMAALRQLHDVGVLHGDIRPEAFHWAGPAGQGELRIIDYDRAQVNAAPQLMHQEQVHFSALLELSPSS